MRNFYVTYNNMENLAPLEREISWNKNVAIMKKCKDQLEENFIFKKLFDKTIKRIYNKNRK